MTLLKDRTFIVLIVLLIFFSFAASNFLSQNTILLIAKHVALYGILTIGMTYVTITGGIDLSVDAVVGLAGVVAGGLTNKGLTLPMFGVTLYFDVPLVVLITVVVGVLVGWLNGTVIARFSIAPFIATLGMMYVACGLAMLHSNGAVYSGIVDKPALGNTGYDSFGGNIMGIPAGTIVLAIIAVTAATLLKFTPFDWHVFAIRGDEKTAKPSGIKVNQVKVMVYILSGVCAAVAGIINSAQLVTVYPASNGSWEMDAIAAAVLGGASVAGGIGGIGGTIVGTFVIGVINNGMVICGVSEFWQVVIKGLVIVLAVVIGQFQRDLQARMALQARGEEKEAATPNPGGNLV